MERNITNRFVVILQRLVRLRSHVQVEPDDLLVVSAEDEVVTLRMHRDRTNPLAAGAVLGDDGLLLEIILEHLHVCRHEEVRLRRMEADGLHYSFR